MAAAAAPKMKVTGTTGMDEETRQKAGLGLIHQTQAQTRRKGIGARSWLVVSESGQALVEEVGKHSIMRRTGLPARDLRALDPVLSYPSSILGRERAIVINLEHIKAIITAKEVLMLNFINPLVSQFVQDLVHRIASVFNKHSIPPQQQGMENRAMDMEDACQPEWGSPVNYLSRRTSPSSDFGHAEASEIKDERVNMADNIPVTVGLKVLPFEFRALEACLESACRCLESETQTLEKEAYPALDELTSKISTLNLERVRQIKSRLVAISGRVQKVRDELEHLLDDDNDMAEMYLTEKMEQTSAREEDFNTEFEINEERAADSKSEGNSEIYTSFKPNIEELEMLLEAYFAQIDGILQKLSHMSEYVDDTEDFINIMLDDKQNQLLQMGVMLGTANMILNAGIVVVGLFGMNINIDLFNGKPIQFWETVMGTVVGCIILYLFAVGWGKKQNLLAL
uniref:Magnesium transporter n=1 Tax=Rhizophora mucronata TaxID=61149 RepID=A0A2P2IZU2_RHIMU